MESGCVTFSFMIPGIRTPQQVRAALSVVARRRHIYPVQGIFGHGWIFFAYFFVTRHVSTTVTLFWSEAAG
jgi:hypothetical protein